MMLVQLNVGLKESRMERRNRNLIIATTIIVAHAAAASEGKEHARSVCSA
jgi:hypothetical protein